MKDLAILVADKDMEQAIRGLLGRCRSLGIRDGIAYDLFVHPRRDPGCLNGAQEILRPLAGAYRYALVLFDLQGCGQENVEPDDLADQLKARLERNGWPGRAQVVVLAPELEVWVWTGSPHVAECMGWSGRQPSLRQWLAAEGHWPLEDTKPHHPKEAFEAALRHVRKPLSSAIYLELARRTSLAGHSEPAFLRFRQTLQEWFPR